MDQVNLFETRTTSRLHRAEYLVFFVITLGFFIWHIGEVRWLPAVLLFVYIDLIGYIPGAIAHHRSKTGRISKAYFVLYNTMHSLMTQTLVIGAWCLLFGWEWALLVIPLHLFGDRGLFGNYYKTFALSFEPVLHPAFVQMRAAVEANPYGGTTDPRAVGTTAPGVEQAETDERTPVQSGAI